MSEKFKNFQINIISDILKILNFKILIYKIFNIDCVFPI